MTYTISESISDSPYHHGPWEMLGIVMTDADLEKVLIGYLSEGNEMIRFKKGSTREEYVFFNPKDPVVTNPVKPCPYGLQNPPDKILTFKHISIDREPKVYDTIRDYAADMAR